MQFEEYKITAKGVKSLSWYGDSLIDWVAGGAIYGLDGSIQQSKVAYAYRFDAVKTSPSGKYAVIFEKKGTKALVLDQGKILREINRSFYYADAYEYPIVLFRLPNGQEVMAHCPEHYCQLEIDDIATGERLTKSDDRKPQDVFFSRLSTNTHGTMLLAAGWVWHPIDIVAVYNIESGLRDPHTLDEEGMGNWMDEYSATFMDNDTIAKIGFWEKAENADVDEIDASSTVSVYDLVNGKQISSTLTESIIGTIMPLDSKTIVNFFEYPKVISLETGKVLHEWAEIETGKQSKSSIGGIESVPPLAFDLLNRRFAVATKEGIEVVQVRL